MKVSNLFRTAAMQLCLLCAVGLAACGGGDSTSVGGGQGMAPTIVPVVPKAWGVPALIQVAGNVNASGPQVKFDAQGNAMAIWSQSDGLVDNMWANRYTAGVGWGVAEPIETNGLGSALDPQIAIDAVGNVVAVWRQSDGTRNNIWANRYAAGLGWGSAELLENDNTGDAFGPQIAVDPNGNAIAIWSQFDGVTNVNITVNRYTQGVGWGTAAVIQTGAPGRGAIPQIASDAGGNMVAVWQQFDGARESIAANRYTAGVGWGATVLLEIDNAGNADQPRLGINASGNAIAVWEQSDGTRFNILSNRYTAGVGWGTAVLIESNDAGNAKLPTVAVDTNGNGVAVWSQSDGTRDNVWANLYTAGTGWGMAGPIETDDLSNALNPEIAMDASGDAIAVWAQSDGPRENVFANRYVAGVGWARPELIETSGGSASRPRIALDGNGNAIAIWIQFNQGTKVLANSLR